MNTSEILKKKGYRFEDLSPKSQNLILEYEESIEDLVQGMELILQEYNETIIEQIKKEAVQEAFLSLREHMEICKNELQIALAESPWEEDDEL